MNYLKSQAINLSYVCQLLYGDASKATRAKLYNKIKSHQGKHFSAEELQKLEEIRKQIIAELKS